MYTSGNFRDSARKSDTQGAELSIQDREKQAEARKAMRQKQLQIIEMEERASDEKQLSKMKEKIRQQERVIERSKSRENRQDPLKQTQSTYKAIRKYDSRDSFDSGRAGSAPDFGTTFNT